VPAHQRRAGQGLERVAAGDDERGEKRRFDAEVDQGRADPERRPEARAEEQRRGERNARGRPYGGGIPGRDGQRD
jgi:hypothetical protein